MNDARDRDRAWSFRRGDWFGVFGARSAVVLPPTEKDRVAAIWELLDDGAGFDETLDALISTGLRGLPGFVLVSSEDGVTRVVIRGSAQAHFATPTGVVHVEGDSATTWAERTLSDVSRVRIEVAEEATGGDLLVAAGLVRLASAEFPAEPAEEAEAEAEEEPADAEEEPETDGDAGSEPDTRTGEVDPTQYLNRPPGIPGQPPAPSVTSRPVARLLLADGASVDVDRAILVGRAPQARRFSSEEQPRLITVPSPQQEISSTHLEVRPGSGADHGSAVVTDLGSTNGTVLIQPGLPPESLRAGIAVQLIPGAVIDLGDGVSIRVVNP